LKLFVFQVKKMGILTANMQKQISQKKPSGGGTILNRFLRASSVKSISSESEYGSGSNTESGF
jgi:hypothetical protein